MKPPRVLYVLGTSYSGSTLLNALMARHSEIVALNEVVNLGSELRDVPPNHARHPLRQPLWRQVDARFRAQGSKLDEIDLSYGWRDAYLGGSAARRRWRLQNERLMSALRAELGERWFVDASKHYRRLDQMQMAQWDVRVVHVVRDGRSVVASGLKRGFGFAQLMMSLHLDASRAERLRRRLPADRFSRLHYEDVTRDPEAAAKKLCGLLHLAFEPAMVALNDPVGHPTAVGAKGFWMLRRGLELTRPEPARLSPALERAYLGAGGPRRDRRLRA